MVGVGQLHLTADLLQVEGGNAALDGGLRAHIHENGGLNLSVGAGEPSPPCPALRFDNFKHDVPPHPINMASPKEKKRYRSSTAFSYAASTFSRPASAETSMMSVLSGK